MRTRNLEHSFEKRSGGITDQFASSYFHHRRNTEYRKNLIIEMCERYIPNKDGYFMSIGCGFAGEETHTYEYIKKGFLIEINKTTIDYAIKFYKDLSLEDKYIFVNSDFYEFKPDNKFNLIYTSGVSDWVTEDPSVGIPNEYIEFIGENLIKNGAFVARLYGGLYIPNVLRDESYIERVKKRIENSKIFLKDYRVDFDIDPAGKEVYNLILIFERK